MLRARFVHGHRYGKYASIRDLSFCNLLSVILFVIFPAVALLSAWATTERRHHETLGVVATYYATVVLLIILHRAGKPSNPYK
jgi:hypothetical protein